MYHMSIRALHCPNARKKPATARKSIPSSPALYQQGDLRDALIRAGRRILDETGPQELSLRKPIPPWN